MKWTKINEEHYEMNLSGILVVKVILYDAGWRGSIQGASFFPGGRNYSKLDDALYMTEKFLSGLLDVLNNEASK